MRRVSVLHCSVLIAVMTVAGSPSAGSSAGATDNAVKAAEAWLALVDAGDYAKSWEEAAKLFKVAVTSEQWNQAMTASRKPLGSMLSRTIKTKQYATSLPGAPDGEYVVIQFTTSFANKKSATETVTPMKDPDGTWRVSGYYIN